MEKDILQIRKEDSIFAKGQRGYLVFPNEHLVPGTLTEGEDVFEIELDTEGLTPALSLKKGQGPDRYRFLIACAGLESLKRAYSFSLDPDNLMFDASFTPKLRLRDGVGAENADFIQDYKALIASIIAPERSYKDYRQGGEGLFKRKKMLLEMSKLETVSEIEELLKKALSDLEKKLSTDSVLVGKGRYRSIQALMIVFICLFTALAAFSVRYYLTELPLKDSAIEISNSFIAKDYIGVLHAVEESSIDIFSKEERYMAAYAGAATASLNDKQRGTVMQTITLNTDSLYLDYWINIGIGGFENALDIARRMGDNELELYSLVIYRDAVSLDMNISGAEKTEMLKKLDSDIDALEKAVLKTS